MKTLYIAIFATFLLAVIIIYHDSKRNESISAISKDGNRNIYVIVCDGTPVSLKASVQKGNFTGIKTRSQFQVTPFQDIRQAESH